MNKAIIYITLEEIEKGKAHIYKRIEGDGYLVLKGLVDAIKSIEEDVQPENRPSYRALVTDMLDWKD